MKAWRSVSVIRSVISASHDPQVQAGWPLGRGRQGGCGRAGTILLEGPQRRSGSAQARHQGANRNTEGPCGLIVGQAVDGHEMQDGALLVRQSLERLGDLLEADPALLVSRSYGFHKAAGLSLAPPFSLSLAPSVDKGVVQDREKPCAKVGTGAERGAALVGAHQGVMDEVLGLSLVAGERTGIAAHRRQLRDDVVPALLRPCSAHAPYTELTADLIPQSATDDLLPQPNVRASGYPVSVSCR